MVIQRFKGTMVVVILETDSEIQAVKELAVKAPRSWLYSHEYAKVIDAIAEWFRKDGGSNA